MNQEERVLENADPGRDELRFKYPLPLEYFLERKTSVVFFGKLPGEERSFLATV